MFWVVVAEVKTFRLNIGARPHRWPTNMGCSERLRSRIVLLGGFSYHRFGGLWAINTLCAHRTGTRLESVVVVPCKYVPVRLNSEVNSRSIAKDSLPVDGEGFYIQVSATVYQHYWQGVVKLSKCSLESVWIDLTLVETEWLWNYVCNPWPSFFSRDI